MKNLILVGFMGSGKSTVGKWVADRLGVSFVDMDALIEQRVGKSIAEIFATEGEANFRQLERALVQELAAGKDQIIAAGGGVVLNPENLRDFQQTGIVIALLVNASAAHQRTKSQRHRPLLEGANRWLELRRLHKQRVPLYDAIPLRVDTTEKGIEAVVTEVLAIYKVEQA
jgi:shikimate kinase